MDLLQASYSSLPFHLNAPYIFDQIAIWNIPGIHFDYAYAFDYIIEQFKPLVTTGVFSCKVSDLGFSYSLHKHQ